MVNLKDVRISNRSLQDLPPGLVAVFAGATDGIGLGTLRQFAKYVNGPIAFIIGRSEEKAAHIIDGLKKLNPMGNFHFIEGQISLIHEVDRVAEEIKRLATHVDILFMSPGYLAFENKETTEGIETALALEYYSRLRLTMDLLPLLRLSTSPRIVSVLGAGMEDRIDPKDLDAVNKLPFWKAVVPAVTMTTLAFEELAIAHPTISFIHTYPGWVNTSILDHLFANASGIRWYLFQIPRYTVFPIIRRLVFMTPEEAGERTLFLATSARYPPAVDHERAVNAGGWVERPTGVSVAESTVMHEGKGNGVYRIYWNGNTLKESKALENCRKEEVGKAVMEHTVAVCGQALTRDGNVPHTKEHYLSLSSEDSFDFEVEL